MNVSGHWEGEYTFEAPAEVEGEETTGKRDSSEGQTVSFAMDLQQGWLGAVNGTVQDDPRTGFKEAGKIKGKLKGSNLEFRKFMPVLRLMHETSRLSLEQWAERRKIVMDTDRPAPPILHEGDVAADGNSVEGRWRLPETTIEVPGSYMHLAIPEMGGTWRMVRKA